MKNKTKIDDSEYGLDSRYSSKKEQDTEAISLMKARLNRMNYLSKE